MPSVDVASPIDLRLMHAAVEWESKAMQRPFRLDFFDAFVRELRQLDKQELKILELGSGPGFLAAHILTQLPSAQMLLLDFSAAMHTLARQRLAACADRVSYLERNFRQNGWIEALGSFDAVVTLQAVHELRHKQHALALHRQVGALLKDGGCYLVCDHYCGEGGMSNDQLFMTLDEQRASLEQANYEVREVLIKGGRALYRASCRHGAGGTS